MRSSTAVGFDAAFGRLTSIPRYIIGAVSMKISSRTSTTSTSGTILISARLVPTRRASDDSVLNAIFRRASRLGNGPAQDVQEIHREALHLDGPVLHAVDEVVVADDRRNGGAETRGGRDQRLGDSRRDDGEACRSLGPDPVERRHDAPHRAEQANERGCAGGSREERQVVLEASDLERRRAPQRAIDGFEAFAPETLVEVVEHLVEDLGNPRDLLISREVELGERALPEPPRRRVHDRGTPRLAEDP